MGFQFYFVSVLLLSCAFINSQLNGNGGNSQGRCSLVGKVGICKALKHGYQYDNKNGKCTRFTWGGCGGVVPFETIEECNQTCVNRPNPSGNMLNTNTNSPIKSDKKQKIVKVARYLSKEYAKKVIFNP